MQQAGFDENTPAAVCGLVNTTMTRSCGGQAWKEGRHPPWKVDNAAVSVPDSDVITFVNNQSPVP